MCSIQIKFWIHLLRIPLLDGQGVLEILPRGVKHGILAQVFQGGICIRITCRIITMLVLTALLLVSKRGCFTCGDSTGANDFCYQIFLVRLDRVGMMPPGEIAYVKGVQKQMIIFE